MAALQRIGCSSAIAMHWSAVKGSSRVEGISVAKREYEHCIVERVSNKRAAESPSPTRLDWCRGSGSVMVQRLHLSHGRFLHLEDSESEINE